MPNSVTIRRARSVAFSMSLLAPVVVSPKLRRSATLPASGQDGSLVDQVGQVGARAAARLTSHACALDALVGRLALGVNLEDLRAAAQVRPIEDDLAIEAARAQERGVQDVGAVGGGDD